MRAHELARALLACPDIPVVVLLPQDQIDATDVLRGEVTDVWVPEEDPEHPVTSYAQPWNAWLSSAAEVSIGPTVHLDPQGGSVG